MILILFFRYQIFPILIPVLFLVPNFTNTDSETFFRYQIIPIPVPKPPAKMKNSRFGFGTKFYQYRLRDFFFRYQGFPMSVTRLFSGTKVFQCRFRDFFRYQFFPIPVPRLFPIPNFTDTGSKTFFRSQFFPTSVLRLFGYQFFCRYRFQDFFPVPIFFDTGSDTTTLCQEPCKNGL